MKPSERLNHSYTLTQTTVEIALATRLVTTPTTVTLELSPRPKVILDCEFTWAEVDAVNEIRAKGEVKVLLSNGTSVDTAVGTPLTLGGGVIRLTLIPKSELVTVKDKNSKLTSTVST